MKNLFKKKQNKENPKPSFSTSEAMCILAEVFSFFFKLKILKKDKSKHMIYVTLLVFKENCSNFKNETNIDQNKSFQYHGGTTDPLEGLSLSLRDKQLWYTYLQLNSPLDHKVGHDWSNLV